MSYETFPSTAFAIADAIHAGDNVRLDELLGRTLADDEIDCETYGLDSDSIACYGRYGNADSFDSYSTFDMDDMDYAQTAFARFA